jgi:hypothetical protein
MRRLPLLEPAIGVDIVRDAEVETEAVVEGVSGVPVLSDESSGDDDDSPGPLLPSPPPPLSARSPSLVPPLTAVQLGWY